MGKSDPRKLKTFRCLSNDQSDELPAHHGPSGAFISRVDCLSGSEDQNEW